MAYRFSNAKLYILNALVPSVIYIQTTILKSFIFLQQVEFNNCHPFLFKSMVQIGVCARVCVCACACEAGHRDSYPGDSSDKSHGEPSVGG